MFYLLFFWGILAILYGVQVLIASQSAMHEIEAGVAFLIATVAIGCGGIIEEIRISRAKIVGKAKESAKWSAPFYET